MPAKKIITPEIERQSKLVANLIRRTWNSIAEDSGETLWDGVRRHSRTTIAAELTLDANRIEMLCHLTDDERAALAEFRKLSWNQQMTLAKSIIGPQ